MASLLVLLMAPSATPVILRSPASMPLVVTLGPPAMVMPSAPYSVLSVPSVTLVPLAATAVTLPAPSSTVRPSVSSLLSPVVRLSAVRLAARSKVTSLSVAFLLTTILPSLLFRSTLSPGPTLVGLLPWALMSQPAVAAVLAERMASSMVFSPVPPTSLMEVVAGVVGIAAQYVVGQSVACRLQLAAVDGIAAGAVDGAIGHASDL